MTNFVLHIVAGRKMFLKALSIILSRSLFWLQIYPSDHNSNNFSSAPSTPGSPQAIAGRVQFSGLLIEEKTEL